MGTSGPVVETVSRKRIVPPAELEQEKIGRSTPEFWQFIESMTEEMWAGDYMLYILREEPKPSLYGGTNTLEKCPGYMIMPNGIRLRLDSREDIELAIKEKWGGKAFRLILKKGRERLTEGKCTNDAPPKYPDNAQQPFSHQLPGATQSGDSNAAIAAKAIDTVANHPSEAMNIAISALRAASEMMAKNAAPPAGTPVAGSLDAELDRAFKTAMIQKLLAAPPTPPDPVETFLKIKQALGDTGGGNNINTLAETVLKSAVERFVNPPAPTVAGKTTLLDLGREFIPVLGNTVRETMHEYRLSREADARIAELSRMQPQPVPAAAPQPMPPMPIIEATTVSAVPAPAPVPAATNPPLTFQQIEAHIAKIVRNLEYPIDEAVDRVLSFLYDTDGRVVGALLNPPSLDSRLKPGKEGLMQLFMYEPELNPCMVNTPRVSEFIDKFLVAAKLAEETEARLRASAPNSTGVEAKQAI